MIEKILFINSYQVMSGFTIERGTSTTKLRIREYKKYLNNTEKLT